VESTQQRMGSDAPDLSVVRAESERLARLVEQLLILARLEQGQWQGRFAPVDLASLCEGVIGPYREKFARLGLSLDAALEPVRMPGDAALLEALLKNLLENVYRHAVGASSVRIALEGQAESVLLTVTDDGPGIDPDVSARMADGFRRLDSRAEGLGLGLAICLRIVAAHQGEIRFRSPTDGTTGLIVEVRFPA